MKSKHWLIIIFLVTLTARLILAFSVPNLTYDSYYHMRQVEHITEHGLPLYQDSLSYGGRELFFLPLFHYVAAFFDLFLPLALVAKILPNIFIASLTIIIYYLSAQISTKKHGPLFSASIAGFLPILYNTNSFTPQTLFLPLVFYTIYLFLNLTKEKALFSYVIAFLALSLTSSATFLLIMGFGIYLILAAIERKRVSKAEVELILFSVFFFIWAQFLFFKNVFIEQGISFIWQNIPSQIVQQYFPQATIAETLILISAIPFLAGVVVAYRSLFFTRNKKLFLLLSFAISTTILTWFRLIEFTLSLSFFGIILAAFFASFYDDIIAYIEQTKIYTFKKYIPALVIFVLLITTIAPAILASLQQETPQDEEIAAFQWLNEHAPKNTGILALTKEGHLITYYSNRQNIIDDQFRLIKDVEKRFIDVNAVFGSSLQTRAIGVLQEYSSQYLVFTPHAQQKTGHETFTFLTEECFQQVYSNQTKIYRTTCGLETAK